MAEAFKGRIWAANLDPATTPAEMSAWQPSWVKFTYYNPEGLRLGFETESDMKKYKESIK